MCGIFCYLEDSSCPVKIELENLCLKLLRRRGPDATNTLSISCGKYRLVFTACVLWLQGEKICKQPLVDPLGNILAWNGDIYEFDNYDNASSGISDTQLLSGQLEKCDGDLEVLACFEKIKGPWAFIYWQKNKNKLWFGRDFFGRQSLLIHQEDGHLILSSLAPDLKNFKFSEVAAFGLYQIELNTVEMKPTLYPWSCSRLTEDSNNFVVSQHSIKAPIIFPSIRSEIENKIDDRVKTGAKPPNLLFEEKLSDENVNLIVGDLLQSLRESVMLRIKNQPDLCKMCVRRHLQPNDADILVCSDLHSNDADIPICSHLQPNDADIPVCSHLQTNDVDIPVCSHLQPNDADIPVCSHLQTNDVDIPVCSHLQPNDADIPVCSHLQTNDVDIPVYSHLQPNDADIPVNYADVPVCSHLQRNGADVPVCSHLQPNGADVPVCSHTRVGVLFSGGLDSAVLAALAAELLPPGQCLDLYNVAFQEEAGKGLQVPDRITGINAYKELQAMYPNRNFKFVHVDVSKEELQKTRRERIKELLHPLDTVLDDSIGCAIWFAARGRGLVASQDGEMKEYASPARVLLLGMGIDEQLGGYSRHRTRYQREGLSGLQEEINMELMRISERNLGRDNRIVADHGVAPRFPFLDENFVSYLNGLELEDKVDLDLPRGVGEKLVLRLAAWRLGFRGTAAEPKRAVQFGSRIAKMENRKEKATDTAMRI